MAKKKLKVAPTSFTEAQKFHIANTIVMACRADTVMFRHARSHSFGSLAKEEWGNWWHGHMAYQRLVHTGKLAEVITLIMLELAACLKFDQELEAIHTKRRNAVKKLRTRHVELTTI